MNFEMSQKGQEYHQRLSEFMDSHVYPAEATYWDQMAASDDPDHHPQILEDLKAEAKERYTELIAERVGPTLAGHED